MIEPRLFHSSEISTKSNSIAREKVPEVKMLDINAWSRTVMESMYVTWYKVLETKIMKSDHNYLPSIAERALSLFDEYKKRVNLVIKGT